MKALLTSLTMAACLATAPMQAVIKDNNTGETFPDQVTFQYEGAQKVLKPTGVATRIKFFVKIYSVAHYLEDSAWGEEPISSIMQDGTAKQMNFIWVRSIGANKVQHAYRESFKQSLTDVEYSSISAEIDQYVNMYGAVKKGEEHILRWLPDGKVEVYMKGQLVGSIHNADFSHALWNIWFGEDSVVNRNDLIKLM